MSKASKPRTIYLVHHHLRRGGVTRVILSTAEILRNAGEQVCILTGEAASETLPEEIPYKRIPGMGYSDPHHPTNREDLLSTLSDLYNEGDIWHLHNHSLGKNPVVTDVFCELADRGHSLVLQPHDFAEDGRPGNLSSLRKDFPGFPDRLYPVASHIRYAVLQARDRNVLIKGGVPIEHIHLLPNPISTGESFTSPQHPPQRLLYLTRAIRRKNVGEFVLWAACFGKDVECATSLIPENPQELSVFKEWQSFAEDETIPVRWGIGMENRSFRDVVEWGDACITTSVGEGFGMSFLEPFAMGRPVVGRNLPEITEGFTQDGVDLGCLYTELPVSVDHLDDEFWPRALQQIQTWRTSMGSQESVSISHLHEAWVTEGVLDFGKLDEIAQREVLRKGLTDLKPEVLSLDKLQPLRENADRIAELYGPEQYLTRLEQLYADLDSPEAVSFADGNRIRDAFLDLKTVCLLRT